MLPEVLPEQIRRMRYQTSRRGYASVAMRRRTLSSEAIHQESPSLNWQLPSRHYLRSTVYNEDSLLRLDEGGRAAKRDKAVLREGLCGIPRRARARDRCECGVLAKDLA